MMSNDKTGQEEQDILESVVPEMEQDTNSTEADVEIEEAAEAVGVDTGAVNGADSPVVEVPAEVGQPVDDEMPSDDIPVDETPAEEPSPEDDFVEEASEEAPVVEVSTDEVAVEEAVTDEQVDEETPPDDLEASAETVDEATSPEGEQPSEESEGEAESELEEPAEPAVEAEAPGEVEVAPRFKRGDLVEGTILKTTPIFIEVDLGEDLVGIVPGRELERMTRRSISELEEGQQITVFVVNPHDHQGRVLLSINRALEEMDWKKAESYRQNQEIYEGRVAGYNKGGLIVRFGRLRGFVPQSQIGQDRRRNLDGETPEARFGGMVNDEVMVKVMEVDRSRNRLILSERAASRERREKRKEILIQELSVGEVRMGSVVSLEDFGAFVDIGGAEGLVHLTEISWKHVIHPRDLLEVGQEVKVEVISIDPQRKRIGLSIKRQEADPWDEVATTYQEGDLVQGVVTKLTKFGAFAQLVESQNIEGLIHISELSDQRVKHPREVVEEGEKLTLRVVKIDVKNRRLGLSLKRVNSAEYLDRDMKTFSTDNEGNDEEE
jgi:small subunit ribosomal protein S1